MQTGYALITISDARAYFAGALSPARGDVFHLLADRPNTIGRHPDAMICIKDGMVASLHCETWWSPDDGAFRIQDLRARNRTVINGSALSNGESRLLQPGDEVRIGQTVFRFDVIDG